jgi:hypothetical protein
MKSAFKPKTHYSIVVAAFTKVCAWSSIGVHVALLSPTIVLECE